MAVILTCSLKRDNKGHFCSPNGFNSNNSYQLKRYWSWTLLQSLRGVTTLTKAVWAVLLITLCPPRNFIDPPPENFEILVLWNAISSVLRGQILSKMFSKSIVLFMLIFIGVTSRRSSQFYFIQVVRFLKLLWISLSAKYYTLCGVIVWVS